jgi:sortase A
MLKIKTKRSGNIVRHAIVPLALILFVGGTYLLSLVGSPVLAPLTVMKPINVSALPLPKQTENRIIIPKIGVNIAYGKGAAALDKGAEWRVPQNGNPETGGNFVIAAHRFSIQPTPLGTIEKSPFYNIDKLGVSDKIVIDYNGTRYGYEITSTTNVPATQTDIEAFSDEPKLTLYSCELDGSASGRVVLIAKPLGKVAFGPSGESNSETN